MWDEMLLSYDQILYIPLSSSLSGSCMTAAALSQEPKYENKVFVVDNGRVSTPLHRSILDAIDLVEDGYTAPQIKDILEASREKTVIYVGLSTLEYLKKGGRITPAAAALGTALRLKPVLQIQGEKLDAFAKARTVKQAKRIMLDAIHKDIETRMGGEVNMDNLHIAAAYTPGEGVEQWLEEIRREFPDKEIVGDPLSLSISCHIGPGALAITVTKKTEY